MSVLYNVVQMDQETSKNTKSFEIYAVTINMTKYHHLINH